MIKGFVVIVVTLMLSGCATPSAKTLEQGKKDKLGYNFSSVNELIAAKYLLKEKSYSNFSAADYESLLESTKGEKAEELRDILTEFDRKSASGYAGGVIVCVFSKKYDFGLCDNTKCAGTEIREIKDGDGLAIASEELKSLSCAKAN